MDEHLIVADLMAELNALGADPTAEQAAAILDLETVVWAFNRGGDPDRGDLSRWIESHKNVAPEYAIIAMEALRRGETNFTKFGEKMAELHSQHPTG